MFDFKAIMVKLNRLMHIWTNKQFGGVQV